MADATTEFFEQLAGRGHEPLLEKASGSVRFDLTERQRTERWLVEVREGEIAVSHRNVRADCIVRCPRTLFSQLARGEENALAALLRGAIEVEGAVGLLVLVQKLFPGPPRSRSRRAIAGHARRQT
jgi:putative sterol carrier protein